MSTFKGILPRWADTALRLVVASKRRAHTDPRSSFRLPVYRDPQARQEARRLRLLAQAA